MGQDVFDPPGAITIFLCGDVMLGRGIDQILPHPSPPRLYESDMGSAVGYVRLAELANGPIRKPVDFPYVWGDALAELERMRPDARIINLETSVTKSEDFLPKGINYRMNPENVPCIAAAKIDCCALANNHVLDWGYSGLLETLKSLESAHIKTAGAGRNAEQAEAPAVLEVCGKGRVLVFSFATMTSGIPPDWAASEDKAGVNLFADLSRKTAGIAAERMRRMKRPGDVVVASLHWGPNWGYAVPRSHSTFAHALIDADGTDVVYGHSSHHPIATEVYKGKPILYGCGDFLNDYEGIRGYEAYRDDLTLMYFLTIDPSDGRLSRLVMTPLQIRNFRLNRVSAADRRWLYDVLNREGKTWGTRVETIEDGRLALRWR